MRVYATPGRDSLSASVGYRASMGRGTTDRRGIRPRAIGRLVACVAVIGAVVSAIALARPGPPATVVVFPSPGTKFNQPRAQIAFRGTPASKLGRVSVVGSRSGVHAGAIEGTSDGNGGSFLPRKPFTPGETVTVTTRLNVVGGRKGVFEFKIGRPAPEPGVLVKVAPLAPGGVQSFHSAPDLHPPTVVVTDDKTRSPRGDVFVAPQYGPVQDGPMIFDSRGQLVWFMPFATAQKTVVTNFRVQRLYGQPVLTWWQGQDHYGNGAGVGMIYDRRYQLVAQVKAANGLDMDFHEFLLTNGGDAYLTASWPVWVPGYRVPVMDSTVQEIDIKTGLVLFQWDALNHVSLRQSYTGAPTTGIYDPFHVNAISVERNGNLVLSMRSTSGVYEVSRRTGKVIWTFGGNASSFPLDDSTETSGQHDVRARPGKELSLFDNGGGPPRARDYSRGLLVRLDPRRKTVKILREYQHQPPLTSNFEGSVQNLAGGDVFIGWGEQPYFSQYDAAGRQVFDAHFPEATASYRAFLESWHATPPLSELRSVISRSAAGTYSLYASWNGATDITGWRLLGGQSPTALAPISTVRSTGFETAIGIDPHVPYYAVQALNASGHVLGTSQTLATPSG